MIHPILAIQNDSHNIQLLQASSVAYSRSKRWEINITAFLLFLALAYPICYLYIQNETLKLILYCCSFFLTILIQMFSENIKGNTAKGAIYKEEFDTIIFKMPWKSTLKRVDKSEIIHLARLYKGVEIKDWYSTKILATIDHNITIAVLQHSNTSWDIELRNTYRFWLICFLIIYSLILSLIFIWLRLDALSIFLLLFSLSSFFTHFITLIRGHKSTIDKRKAISHHLDEIIRHKKQTNIQELRDIQDEIYITRHEAAKVPNFFFTWYQKRFNSEIEDYINEVNELYKQNK